MKASDADLVGRAAVKQYKKRLARELSDMPALKRRILQQIQEPLDEFLETNPNVNRAMLNERFGSPEKVAEDAVASIEAAELKRQLRHGRLRRAIVVAVVGVLLALAVWKVGIVVADRLVNPPYFVVEAPVYTDPSKPLPTQSPVE